MDRKLSFGSLLAVILAWLGFCGAVTVPVCQTTAAPPEKNLTDVRTAEVAVPAHPFGLAYAHQKDRAFVALNTSLGVFDTSALSPSLIHEIPLPAAALSFNGATGIGITHDGRYVLVTTFSTTLIIVDAARAVTGSLDAVVGVLNGTAAAGSSGIEVTVTQDGQYAFVSQEDGSPQTDGRGNVEVFKLDGPTANGSFSGTPTGYLTLGVAVVGTALSPDGSLLYATSEMSSNTTGEGTISVIDVEKLKTDPSNAVISSVTAGCGAVRVIVSQDGQRVWLTARESNALLAFDAAKLISNPTDALLASVQVGTAPVGLTFARNDTRILTANSNRFNFPNATTGLSVVDAEAAICGEEAVLGQISTGLFPRELAVSPDGSTVLVADYASSDVRAVDVATLP